MPTRYYIGVTDSGLRASMTLTVPEGHDSDPQAPIGGNGGAVMYPVSAAVEQAFMDDGDED